MARILIVEHDGPARRVEVSDDPENITGMMELAEWLIGGERS